MNNNTPLKALFKSWCTRFGYTPARSVHCMSTPGSAALNTHKGRWTISVFNGYDYDSMELDLHHPFKGLTEEQAREYLSF